jgi:hypothetical protein
MLEIVFFYQLARNPLQAMARRWYCSGLYRASRGKRRCTGCPGARASTDKHFVID